MVLPELKAGENEDDALARGLGMASADALSDVQRRYKERVKAKLAEVRCSAEVDYSSYLVTPHRS